MKTPRFWQSHNLIRTALLPASALYGIGAKLDRIFSMPKRASLPVISVGNVTAGGAGKTPTTLALIPILRSLGHTPHILTRGYKGAALTAHRVQENDDWKIVGDEALLLAQAAPTWVGRNRFAAAHAAEKSGATILVCDDALQHHALHKDISILVIDGPYGIGNGALIPAGPLRETFASGLARADAVVMVGADTQRLATHIPLPIFSASLRPTGDLRFLNGKKFLAFAGIARPEKFYTTLRDHGATLVATRDFADHHAYDEADIRALVAAAETLGAPLITTAKDAVKIPSPWHASIAVLPVALGFADSDAVTSFLAHALSSIRPS